MTFGQALAELQRIGYGKDRSEKIMRLARMDGSWDATVAGLPVSVVRYGNTYQVKY